MELGKGINRFMLSSLAALRLISWNLSAYDKYRIENCDAICKIYIRCHTIDSDCLVFSVSVSAVCTPLPCRWSADNVALPCVLRVSENIRTIFAKRIINIINDRPKRRRNCALMSAELSEFPE